MDRVARLLAGTAWPGYYVDESDAAWQLFRDVAAVADREAAADKKGWATTLAKCLQRFADAQGMLDDADA